MGWFIGPTIILSNKLFLQRYGNWNLPCTKLRGSVSKKYCNTSLIRHRPYKWGYLTNKARRSTFQAISPDYIGFKFRWLDKEKWKLLSFNCGDSQQGESARTRCRVPYKCDSFISEWGDPTYRPMPYRWGISVLLMYYSRVLFVYALLVIFVIVGLDQNCLSI